MYLICYWNKIFYNNFNLHLLPVTPVDVSTFLYPTTKSIFKFMRLQLALKVKNIISVEVENS